MASSLKRKRNCAVLRKRSRCRQLNAESNVDSLLARVIAMSEETDEVEMEDELMRSEIDLPAVALLMAKCSRFLGTMHDVPEYTAEEYPIYFHVSKRVFNELCMQVSELPIVCREDGRSGRPALPVDYQILIFLWFLANPHPVQMIADKFEISKSSVVNVVKRVTDSILKHMFPSLVAWPDDEEKSLIEKSFLDSYGIPGVIGVLDAMYVPIKSYLEQPSIYKNSKGVHSVILQMVCTEEMNIIDCYTEAPGNLLKLQCLLSSPLFTNVEGKFKPDEHVVAGLDYAGCSWILTPYPQAQLPESVKFNKQLCHVRGALAKTFSALIGRFPRLKSFEMKYVEDISALLMVACALHNFCIIHGDDPNIYAKDLVDINESKNPVVLIDDSELTAKRNRIAFEYSQLNCE